MSNRSEMCQGSDNVVFEEGGCYACPYCAWFRIAPSFAARAFVVPFHVPVPRSCTG